MFLNIVCIVLIIGYITYVVLESIISKRLRKSFKYVIHVNGIRGKSTTTRLIDAGFRNLGYKVFSKTTGTVPTIINVDNKDIPIKRLGPANIREQISMMLKAKKEGAEVLVLECMAVNPELQKICEEKILKANVTVITNVRPDHIGDMGKDLDEIAQAFCNTIPTNGHLVINNGEYVSLFTKESKNKNTKVHVASKYDGSDLLDTFEENIALALEVATTLNLDKNLFFEGMKNYHHDIGAFEEIKLEDTIFLNGFSINDPVSIKLVYEKVLSRYNKDDITILLNSRSDRPTRTIQHIEMMKELPCKKILLYGSNPSFIKKKLVECNINIDIEILNSSKELKNEKVIFAIGNIGGKGMKILEYFRMNGEVL